MVVPYLIASPAASKQASTRTLVLNLSHKYCFSNVNDAGRFAERSLGWETW